MNSDGVIVEKVPSLTCKKCGGFRVMMTDDGPECDECDAKPQLLIDLTEEVEYFIEQTQNEEKNTNEAF